MDTQILLGNTQDKLAGICIRYIVSQTREELR